MSSKICQSFDSISPRYDFLNLLLSFHLDRYWRKQTIGMALDGAQKTVLDLGTGTGKLLELLTHKQKWERVAGLDFSPRMLKRAQETLKTRAALIRGDFESLPFSSESFDLVISAFTLRSVTQMEVFFEQIYPVLSMKGKVVLLCLTRPPNPFLRLFFEAYVRFFLPLLGGLLSGNFQAYRFLSRSVLEFPEPRETMKVMQKMGFHSVSKHRLTFGITTVLMGTKN